MRKLTRKLSGPAKEHFFRRFFGQQPDIEAALAEALTRRSAATFSSVRVRREAWGEVMTRSRSCRVVPSTDRGRAEPTAPVVPPTELPSAPSAVPAPSAEAAPAAFDPYIFGLVPVFQREGRDGLLVRLREVAEVAQLRQMARAQQISLTPELRTGDIDTEVLRAAIADSVAKRIADRRAAAGDRD